MPELFPPDEHATWIFGGICKETREAFFLQVPDRRGPTLEALIQEHILPGSHIISDGWAAYNNINEQIRNGITTHSVIIHDENFVNPNDYEIYTQNVENV